MNYSEIYNVQELKASAYDAMATAENAQRHLRAINQRIAELERKEASDQAKSDDDKAEDQQTQ